jgi:hypothetical protein
MTGCWFLNVGGGQHPEIVSYIFNGADASGAFAA